MSRRALLDEFRRAVGRNYSAGGISVALLVALTTLAAEGNHRRTALAALVMLSSFVLVRALWVDQGWNYRRTLISPGLVIGGCFAAAFLGVAVSSRRARAEEAERSREDEARRRVDAERIRIAREFHDIVGHTSAAVMSARRAVDPARTSRYRWSRGRRGRRPDGRRREMAIGRIAAP